MFKESGSVKKFSDMELVFKNDSSESKIIFYPEHILTVKNNITDTFKLENKELRITNEELMEGTLNLLVKRVEFDVYFQKQKFHLIFIKNYDAYSKLILETSNGN